MAAKPWGLPPLWGICCMPECPEAGVLPITELPPVVNKEALGTSMTLFVEVLYTANISMVDSCKLTGRWQC